MNQSSRVAAKTVTAYVQGRRVDVDLLGGEDWTLEEVRVHGLPRLRQLDRYPSEEAALDQARQIASALIEA